MFPDLTYLNYSYARLPLVYYFSILKQHVKDSHPLIRYYQYSYLLILYYVYILNLLILSSQI